MERDQICCLLGLPALAFFNTIEHAQTPRAVVPKKVKGGPRKVTELDVGGGPKDHFEFGNHAVIVVAPDDSALGTMLMTFSVGGKAVDPPPSSFPTGAAGYRNYVAVWDNSPTPDQTKLVEGCLHSHSSVS